jgi:hypothetical protein
MSLTSYRAAPPRVTILYPVGKHERLRDVAEATGVRWDDVVDGFWFVTVCAPAAMPGDDLLFHRLGDSTIGAVGFHGRVRDGIGWDTDAMVTRQ